MEVYGDSNNLINLIGFRNAKVVNEGSKIFLRVNVDHEDVHFEPVADEAAATAQLAELKLKLEAMGS